VKKKLNHYLQGIYWWLEQKCSDLSNCELCNSMTVAKVCIGCGSYVCYGCDSGYYEDETLCLNCRKEITPEQEAEDWKDAMAEEDYHGTRRVKP
jgi:predicted amidophosphoribosyltransferase